MTVLEKLRTVAGGSLLFGVLAGCFGHHTDTAAYLAILCGALVGFAWANK